jgi:hypothetical protein
MGGHARSPPFKKSIKAHSSSSHAPARVTHASVMSPTAPNFVSEGTCSDESEEECCKNCEWFHQHMCSLKKVHASRSKMCSQDNEGWEYARLPVGWPSPRPRGKASHTQESPSWPHGCEVLRGGQCAVQLDDLTSKNALTCAARRHWPHHRPCRLVTSRVAPFAVCKGLDERSKGGR